MKISETVFTLVVLAILSISNAIAQDGVLIDYVGTTRDASAILDLRSTNQGTLMPRVDIIDLSTAAPVSAPATGLLVYNTNVASGVGYYYWNGTRWTRFVDNSTGSNFVTGTGTQDYVTKWNNATGTTIGNSLIFDNGTNVGIGNTSPDAPLTIGDGTNAAAYLNIKRSDIPHIQLFEGATSVARIQGDIVSTHPQFQITTSNGVTSLFNVNQDNGKVGVGATDPSGLLELKKTTQLQSNLVLSGQEYYGSLAPGTNTGIALVNGVNRAGNKQLWIMDQDNVATQNATSGVIRLMPNASQGVIDAIATNGATSLPLVIGSSTSTVSVASLVTNGLVKATSGVLSIADGTDLPSGSLNYIQNQNSVDQIANFRIKGSGLINGGLTNTSTRPAIAAGTMVNGELRAFSNSGPGSDDGFLRISAGGGTTAGVKSYIDLSGYATNAVPDMVQNIAFGTSGTERMRIKSDGNVGIGTTDPTNTLTVYGTNADAIPILGLRSGNASTTHNNGAQIAFGYNGTDDYQHFIQTRHNTANSNNAIDFYVSDGTQNNTLTSGSINTMSLVSGSVGIGVSSSLAGKLHVAASIAGTVASANGALIVDNSVSGNGKGIWLRNLGGGSPASIDIVGETFNGHTGAAPATIRFIDSNYATDISFRVKTGQGLVNTNNGDAEMLRVTAAGGSGVMLPQIVASTTSQTKPLAVTSTGAIVDGTRGSASATNVTGGWPKNILTFTATGRSYLMVYTASIYSSSVTSRYIRVMDASSGGQYASTNFYFNTTNVHTELTGSAIITPSAGSVTLQMQTSGSSDLNDYCTITVVEL